MITKEQYANIIYRRNQKTYTCAEVCRFLDLQCGNNVHDAYRADVLIYKIGRRYIIVTVSASESHISGPFATQKLAEQVVADSEYKGPSNEEILYYLPRAARSVEMVDKILLALEHSSLSYFSIFQKKTELFWLFHDGYLKPFAPLVACVETNKLFSDAHRRIALYKALQYENDKYLDGIDSVGIDACMYT